MWLLSTDRAELHYFRRNFDAIGGYAILSHTWDGDEQTLQEVQAIGDRCRTSEKHGYHWVWIDSCCIDKTSSSELSEAINSMFRWYKEAEVCFVYLADVPHDCDLDADDSAFRKSRWHIRGWTLQELIAPDFLIFLSNDISKSAKVSPNFACTRRPRETRKVHVNLRKNGLRNGSMAYPKNPTSRRWEGGHTHPIPCNPRDVS
ncbi:hypothetical protein V8D89_012185 [Ganoderma adspersum]